MAAGTFDGKKKQPEGLGDNLQYKHQDLFVKAGPKDICMNARSAY